MKKAKQRRLKQAGWKTGSAGDFLGLSPEEAAFVELKLALARYLKQRRQSKRLTQVELARILHSSQSRIAKMEAGDPTVSLDLLFRSLFFLETSPQQLAKIIRSLSTSTA